MTAHVISLRGREFRLCALTLGDLRRLEPALLGAEQRIASGFGSMLSLVPVIHASISKLHPEVALEKLEDMLDLNNFTEVLDRVLEASGLKRSVPAAVAVGSTSLAADPVGEDQPGPTKPDRRLASSLRLHRNLHRVDHSRNRTPHAAPGQ